MGITFIDLKFLIICPALPRLQCLILVFNLIYLLPHLLSVSYTTSQIRHPSRSRTAVAHSIPAYNHLPHQGDPACLTRLAALVLGSIWTRQVASHVDSNQPSSPYRPNQAELMKSSNRSCSRRWSCSPCLHFSRPWTSGRHSFPSLLPQAPIPTLLTNNQQKNWERATLPKATQLPWENMLVARCPKLTPYPVKGRYPVCRGRACSNGPNPFPTFPQYGPYLSFSRKLPSTFKKTHLIMLH